MLMGLPWGEAVRALLPDGAWAEVEAAAPAAWEAAPGVFLSLDFSSGPHPVALLPLNVAFSAALASGTPPPPAAGVRLVLPETRAPLADAPSLESLWKDWPRIRAALRRRPGKSVGEWPEAAPGGAVVSSGGVKGGKKKGQVGG